MINGAYTHIKTDLPPALCRFYIAVIFQSQWQIETGLDDCISNVRRSSSSSSSSLGDSE